MVMAGNGKIDCVLVQL